MTEHEQKRDAETEAAAEEAAASAEPGDGRPGDGAPDDPPDPQDGTSSGVDEAVVRTFEEELAEARRRADENWDRYLRAEADLENVRRRAEQRRREAAARERRKLLTRVLDVADNLERALSYADADPEALASGVESTYRELGRWLTNEGVEPITAMDAAFDPNLHEAVSVVPAPDLDEERVIAVERTGYTMEGTLLRPARVVVGRPPGEEG